MLQSATKLVSIIFIVVIFFGKAVYASDYVLPYPSYMPGNKIYKISRLLDKINKYWYFGNISQYRYHLMLSDKYLVEAKTLFEYKQYLLAVDALKRSNEQFAYVAPFIQKAKSEGKDTASIQNNFQNASIKHIEILDTILLTVPESFSWEPEKMQPTVLQLHELLVSSIAQRKVQE